MAEDRLRELERRWKETQSVEDEAAYLLERVRTGDLEKEKLELAAYCGHAGSRAALGDAAPEAPETPEDWLKDCQSVFGNKAILRLLACAVEGAQGIRLPPSHQAALPMQVEALREWLKCPCDEHAEAFSKEAPLGRARSPTLSTLFGAVAYWCRQSHAYDFVTSEGLVRQAIAVLAECGTARRSPTDVAESARKEVASRILERA